MIYESKTHSIISEMTCYDNTFSLTISTLELVIDLKSKKLLTVEGYFPLIQAVNKVLNLPNVNNGDFYITNFDFSFIEEFDVYKMSDMIPDVYDYFHKNPIYFDKINNIILFGDSNCVQECKVKINKNIIIGYDHKLNLKCIYIILDKYII